MKKIKLNNVNYKLPERELGSNTVNPNIFLSYSINNIMAFSCLKGVEKR